MARSFALRVIAGQITNGIWGYSGVLLTPEQEGKLLASLRDGTYKPAGAAPQSMSCTQFAMLSVGQAQAWRAGARAALGAGRLFSRQPARRRPLDLSRPQPHRHQHLRRPHRPRHRDRPS